MAAFIVSIEKVSTTFTATAGVTSNTVNLSKSQDETKCVPFCTNYVTTTGGDIRNNDFVGLEMIDNAGTPAVKIHRYALAAPASAIHVDIFVIEFGSNVTVQQGSSSLTGTTVSGTISAITLANSFCVFSQVGSTATGSDDANDTFVQARFGSTTSVDFDRRSGGVPDWTIYWYVVESNGADFLTEYVNDSWANSESGPTGLTLSNIIALADAFVIASYESAHNSDDMEESVVNVALTGTTTLTWYRNNGGSLSASGTIGVWVVRGSSTEFNVQRFALDLAASTTNDQMISAIDQTQAVVINSSNISGGTWSVDSSTTGSDFETRRNSLVFTSTTNVRAQQQSASASGGTDSRLRFEVVEFEFESVSSGRIMLGLMGVGI